MLQNKPHLTFFCELGSPDLSALFNDPEIIRQLTELKASISLGLLDLSAERAKVVHQLNQAGIPLHAWLLLPMEQGYWFNLDNAPQGCSAIKPLGSGRWKTGFVGKQSAWISNRIFD